MSIILFLFILLLIFILISRLSSSKPDRSLHEPPILHPQIPIIGHILGFLRHRIFYLEHLAAKCSSPIFTLRVFNYRIHVITDPGLLSVMHRHSSPSFDPMIVAIADSIVGDSPNILRLMHAPPNAKGINEYMVDTHASLHTSMSPGPGLWDMNAKVLERIAEMVNAIGPEFEEKGLWYWFRGCFTRATSEALFGVHHPLANDPSLVQAVWFVLLFSPSSTSNLQPPTPPSPPPPSLKNTY